MTFEPTPCRLYLMTPPNLTENAALDDFAPRLSAALEAGDVAAVLLRSAGLPEAAARQAIESLRPIAQAREAAFIIEGTPELASETGCDGIHLPSEPRAVAAARRILGEDGIVGAQCGVSRHQALLSAEAGADYIAFIGDEAAMVELLSWWQETMVVPCVAFADDGSAAALAQAGADFLALGETLWQDPAGPTAAIQTLQAQIEKPQV